MSTMQFSEDSTSQQNVLGDSHSKGPSVRTLIALVLVVIILSLINNILSGLALGKAQQQPPVSTHCVSYVLAPNGSLIPADHLRAQPMLFPSQNFPSNEPQYGSVSSRNDVTSTREGNMGKQLNGCPKTECPVNKTYLVAYGHNFGAYEYIDNGGYHRGFHRELVEEVCQAAGVICKAVFDKYNNAWDDRPGRHAILGPGLQGRYYDAASGWAISVERLHAAAFSKPFLKASPATFFYKSGASFDSTDFTNKTIGMVDGWVNNEKCIVRNFNTTSGIPLAKGQCIYALDPKELKNLILEGRVDAGFGSWYELGKYVDRGLLEYDPSITRSCALDGGAMMSRMDSDFPQIWNRGFDIIYKSGRFKQLCQIAHDAHGHMGEINCID